MMSPTTVILVTAVLCAAACSLLGTFLVLRRMAMMTDAISHAILLGIVLGFFVYKVGVNRLPIGMVIGQGGINLGQSEMSVLIRDLLGSTAELVPAGNPAHRRASARNTGPASANAGSVRDERSDVG